MKSGAKIRFYGCFFCELSEKSTEGDKVRIENTIERQTNELAALREQLKLVQAKIENNQSVNTEVERIKKLLTDDSLNFDVYDDMTVRMLVEYIRVMEEGKIVIMFKGGITIEERVEQEQCSDILFFRCLNRREIIL